eukprot:gene16208-biopygen6745
MLGGRGEGVVHTYYPHPLNPKGGTTPGLKDLCQKSPRDDFRQKISTRSQPGRRRRQGTCADFFRGDGAERTCADFFSRGRRPADVCGFFFARPAGLTTDMCFFSRCRQA